MAVKALWPIRFSGEERTSAFHGYGTLWWRETARAEIITLQDNIRVEAEITQARAAFKHGKVDQSLDAIQPVLIRAVQPIAAAWKELNRGMTVSEAQVELGFGFEASGNVFLATTKGNVNLKVTLTLKPAS
jgi:hypothetical protein